VPRSLSRRIVPPRTWSRWRIDCARLRPAEIFGAYADSSKRLRYTDNSKCWFDLSLISAYGKLRADKLKFQNRRTYQELVFEGLGFRFAGETYLLPEPIETGLSGDVAIAADAGPIWPMKKWTYYDELKQRFGAPGDFAEAYVLAHEIGHHVQKLLGVEQRVMTLERSQPSARNALSVKMELQADCLAGVWAHSTDQRHLLEKGDAESAMNAAAAVGDDRLQKMSTGRVSPESFTHGTSAQRTQWFSRGMDQGTIAACNTFQ